MYVDASVIIAILNREADGEDFAGRIDARRSDLLASPLAIFEAAAGLAKARIGNTEGKATVGEVRLAHAAVLAFVAANDVRVVEITASIGAGAIEAAATYGKTVGHPAALNFGDCFAYACARTHGTDLLFKGDDFSKTDIARWCREAPRAKASTVEKERSAWR